MQVAIRASTGEPIEAFSATDAEWQALCSYPKGGIIIPRTNWPAVAKTSVRGLRFFAHLPGYSGALPKPESYAHTRLKIDLVKSARSLGYQADIEVTGCAPDGESWVADVMVTLLDGQRTAFEVQLSTQHLREFRLRTERYLRSSVRCCWVVAEKPVASRLAKAIGYENTDYYRSHGEFQVDDEGLVLLGASIASKDEYPVERPLLRFGRGRAIRRLQMQDAIEGVLLGLPRWQTPQWYWGHDETGAG